MEAKGLSMNVLWTETVNMFVKKSLSCVHLSTSFPVQAISLVESIFMRIEMRNRLNFFNFYFTIISLGQFRFVGTWGGILNLKIDTFMNQEVGITYHQSDSVGIVPKSINIGIYILRILKGLLMLINIFNKINS